MPHPLVWAASQLREAAQTHKRLSAQHRRQARQLMQAYSDLQDECRRAGLRFETATLDERAEQAPDATARRTDDHRPSPPA